MSAVVCYQAMAKRFINLTNSVDVFRRSISWNTLLHHCHRGCFVAVILAVSLLSSELFHLCHQSCFIAVIGAGSWLSPEFFHCCHRSYFITVIGAFSSHNDSIFIACIHFIHYLFINPFIRRRLCDNKDHEYLHTCPAGRWANRVCWNHSADHSYMFDGSHVEMGVNAYCGYSFAHYSSIPL